MALQKAIPTSVGIDASYWRIIRASFDVRGQQASYTIAGYYDLETRNEEKQPLREISYDVSNVPDPDSVNRSALYEHAKSQEEFAGALNV